MNKALKISAIVFVASLAVSCASTSDVEGLQNQVNDLEAKLESKINKASADAASAQSAAQEAAARASAAEAAANRAASAAESTESKLDRMFKKSMMK